MIMNMTWVWIIVVGILAGFIAGKIMRGRGYGLIVDLLLGIVGSFVGGWIFTQLHISMGGGLVAQLLMALVGALLLLFIVRLIKRV